MRIAIVADPYIPIPPPKYGGTERVIYYLLKGLKEAGHEPLLVGPGDSKIDVPIYPTVEESLSFPRDKNKLPAFEKAVKQAYLNTEKILNGLMPEVDVIHSHGYDLLKFKDFPNVTTIHGPFIIIGERVTDKDISYFRAHQELNYVAISRNQKKAYPGLGYLKVVYNGEDPDEFPVVTTPDNYVVFIGRFDDEKNPHLAIQLAIEYGIKIKLAGKIDYQGNDYFNNEVKPLLKHPLVEYLGELNRKQTTRLLSKAKANLHPTGFREPFGLTVLEAAYAGTPTLAIERGSMPELIQEDKTGILVEDFVEGVHQLERLFGLDREYIAKRSRKKFNYKNMAKGYWYAYRRAIKKARRT